MLPLLCITTHYFQSYLDVDFFDGFNINISFYLVFPVIIIPSSMIRIFNWMMYIFLMLSYFQYDPYILLNVYLAVEVICFCDIIIGYNLPA